MQKSVTAAIAGAGILISSSACTAPTVTAPAVTAPTGSAPTVTAPTGSASTGSASAVSASQKSCTFTWFNIDDRDVLTAVSEVRTLAKGEKMSPSMRVLRSGVAQVTGVKLDNPQAAITSLGKRVGQSLAPVGATYPSKGPHGDVSFDAAGRYVLYQMASHLVDADFVVECDGKRLGLGHATSWRDSDTYGTAECGVKTGDERIADMALRLAC